MKSPSMISAATVVRGNVSGDGSLEVLGRVEGSVSVTGQVIVATDAVIKGNVSASEIQVAGNVLGNLTASDLLVLNTGARVVGDLAGARIGVAEGALVRGLVRTEGEPPLAQPVPVQAARAVSPAAKPGAVASKGSFAMPPAARPAPTFAARPPAANPPKPVIAVAPPVHEKPVLPPEPQVRESEEDDDMELEEPTNPPPPPHAEHKHERPAQGAPPMVVPAIKGQVKAKKKFKGR